MLEDNCPGCAALLTPENAGGFQDYCAQCVRVLPPLPEDGRSYRVKGCYPHLRWVRVKRGGVQACNST